MKKKIEWNSKFSDDGTSFAECISYTLQSEVNAVNVKRLNHKTTQNDVFYANLVVIFWFYFLKSFRCYICKNEFIENRRRVSLFNAFSERWLNWIEHCFVEIETQFCFSLQFERSSSLWWNFMVGSRSIISHHTFFRAYWKCPWQILQTPLCTNSLMMQQQC